MEVHESTLNLRRGRTANLTETIGSGGGRIEKLLHAPSRQCLQIFRYAASRERTSVACLAVFDLVITCRRSSFFSGRRTRGFVRGHFRALAASVGASSFNIHGSIVAIGGRRCLIRKRSRRKLHTCEKKSIVLLRMFVRSVNRNVAFSAKNCPILLTEYERAPFLHTKSEIKIDFNLKFQKEIRILSAKSFKLQKSKKRTRSETDERE